jgi:transcriptional regulator with XRE-family HTH domain
MLIVSFRVFLCYNNIINVTGGVVMELKDRLVKLRKELGLTQEDFAQRIGYTRTAVSAWEIGRNEPSNSDTIKIANFFGVSTDYLLGKSDVRNPEKKDNDLLDLASMGFNADSYTPPTSTQKEQIKGLLEVVLKDNKKNK